MDVVFSGMLGSRAARIELQPFVYTQKTATAPRNWRFVGDMFPTRWTAAMPAEKRVRFDIPAAATIGNALFPPGLRVPVFDMVPN